MKGNRNPFDNTFVMIYIADISQSIVLVGLMVGIQVGLLNFFIRVLTNRVFSQEEGVVKIEISPLCCHFLLVPHISPVLRVLLYKMSMEDNEVIN